MPDVRNCKRCGKLYNYIGGIPICLDCKKADEVDFKRVKEYLYDHPGASMIDVSNILEISMQRIKAYLKEGRLEIVGDDGNMILECESCGRSIRTGRFCEDCAAGLTNDMKDTMQKMKVDDSSKKPKGMRYLHKEK